MSPSTRLRRVAVEGAFALAILFLLFAIAEGAFRLLWDDSPLADHAASEALAGLPILHSTADLARANTRGANAGALYETNSAGFRGPECPADRPSNVFRLAVIGDSTAMGWGVELEDTFAARVERLINSRENFRSLSPVGSSGSNERAAPLRFEVLNFALAGLDARGIAQRFEKLALEFQPNLVIYAFTLNDIKGEHYRRSLDRDYADSLRRNDSAVRLWRWARPRWLAFRELLFAPDGSYAGELDDNYFNNPEALRALDGHLASIAALSEQRDICRVLIVNAQIQSLHALHPYRRHYAAVAELGRSHGFYTAQSIDRMLGEDAASLWVAPNDWHANARGHAILAEIALELLEDLPAECWKEAPAASSTF